MQYSTVKPFRSSVASSEPHGIDTRSALEKARDEITAVVLKRAGFKECSAFDAHTSPEMGYVQDAIIQWLHTEKKYDVRQLQELLVCTKSRIDRAIARGADPKIRALLPLAPENVGKKEASLLAKQFLSPGLHDRFFAVAAAITKSEGIAEDELCGKGSTEILSVSRKSLILLLTYRGGGYRVHPHDLDVFLKRSATRLSELTKAAVDEVDRKASPVRTLTISLCTELGVSFDDLVRNVRL